MSYLPGTPVIENQAARLRARLDREEILLVPTPYDAISARLAVEAGFDALFMGGYAVAAARFGVPDIGLVSATEMLDAARSIINAAGIPVLVDGDTGYGGAMNVRRTVLELAQAGAAAVMIEDQQWPKRCGHLDGKRIVDRQEAVLRIRAAVRAREESRDRVLILARTDARGVAGFDEACWRMQAFADEGADILFLEAPVDEQEMEHANGLTSLPTMANMLEEGKTPVLPPARLQELGYALAAYPVTLLGAAAYAVRAALAAIRKGEPLTARISHPDLLALTGYDAVQDRDQSLNLPDR